jgi:hypothetical protein
VSVLRWFVTALLAACGATQEAEPSQGFCERPSGTHTVVGTLIDGPCDSTFTDTVNFDGNDPCITRELFDPEMCIYEGSGTCDGITLVFVLDDPTQTRGMLTLLDGFEPLCFYEARLQ